MLQAALAGVFGFRPIDERDLAVRYDLTAKALRTLGPEMRLISGRKNLVWVTHGVPEYTNVRGLTSSETIVSG